MIHAYDKVYLDKARTVLGRMLAEDTNWDSQNRILGENEQPDIYVILQGANLYVYCNGNPIFFIDGTGFEWYSSAFNKTAGISVNLGPFGQGYYAGNDGELKRLQPELGASASDWWKPS